MAVFAAMMVGWRAHFAIAGIASFALSAGCGGNVKGLSGGSSGDGATTGGGGASGVDAGATGGSADSGGQPSTAGSGGKTSAAGSGGDARASGGKTGSAGSPAAPARTDTAEERAQACGLYFTTMFSLPCGPRHPPGELSRLARRFEESCVGEFDLPGNINTASALTACVKAMRVTDCSRPDGAPHACDVRGALPGGAACILGSQCQSGICTGSMPDITPGGRASGADTCGTCATAPMSGDPCEEGCEVGAICVNARLNDPGDPYRCATIEERLAGESCNNIASLCKPELFCNDDNVCEKLPELNEPCPSGLCAAPFVCRPAGGTTSTCQPLGNTGDDCTDVGDRVCAASLVCGPDHRCVTILWAGPGEACDSTHRCVVGDCPRGLGPHTCPRTVPDGQPCTSDWECDAPSRCLNPDGPPGVATGVCGSPARVVCVSG